MSLKTKLFSLLLLGLLILPALLGPQPSGSVLGAFESRLPTSERTPEAESSGSAMVGEIASGAFERKSLENRSDKEKVYHGKAVWDDNTKVPVSTDKFTLGKDVRITVGSKSLNLVVGDIRILEPDILVVLNRKTFQDLGGSPDTEKYIEVVLTVK